MNDFNIQHLPNGDCDVTCAGVRPLSRVIQVLIGPNTLPVRQEWINGRGWVTAGLPV